jgi:hypothetical protein
MARVYLVGLALILWACGAVIASVASCGLESWSLQDTRRAALMKIPKPNSGAHWRFGGAGPSRDISWGPALLG